jgi:hypothetical protein
MKDRSAFYTITCQNCYSKYQQRQKPKERLCSPECREQWLRKIKQMRAERPVVTRQSTSNSIADDLGEFYEPGNPGNPVRVKAWYLFVAEAFKLKDGIVATALRKLLPLYKQDPTSQPFDKALEQWIRLFNLPEFLIVQNENISANDLLSRLAVEILGHWARHPRAAKRCEMPPRPATWTWAESREAELSKVKFATQIWRFRVEKRLDFERRTIEECKRSLAEQLDEKESRIAAMKKFERTPGIRLDQSSHLHWAARIQVLGDIARESERPGVLKGARDVFRLMGVNPLKRRGRPRRK